MIQERYVTRPWRLLVTCLLLNRTRGEGVIEALPGFFRRWPVAASVLYGDHENFEELIAFLQPFGLQYRKTHLLIGLSAAWLEWELFRPRGERVPPEETVGEWPGVGPYALDVYRHLVLGDTEEFASGDPALALWRTERGLDDGH